MATRSSSIISVLPIPLDQEPTELPNLAIPSEIYYCETTTTGDVFVVTIKSGGGIQTTKID